MPLHPSLEILSAAAVAPLVPHGCSSTETAIECSVALPLYDGEISNYHLVISIGNDSDGEKLVVQEQASRRRLPAACPGRHINIDGTFCLGWGPTRPVVPRSAMEAESAWAQIEWYLHYQDRASACGTWPARATWAHGDSAARAQREIEELDRTLPADLRGLQALDVERLTRRKVCPCGRGQRVKDCHEMEIAKLREASTEKWSRGRKPSGDLGQAGRAVGRCAIAGYALSTERGCPPNRVKPNSTCRSCSNCGP